MAPSPFKTQRQTQTSITPIHDLEIDFLLHPSNFSELGREQSVSLDGLSSSEVQSRVQQLLSSGGSA